MLAAIRMTRSLLKLRIAVAIAASALAGMAATKGPAISVAQASALALAVLGASGAAGAFNHYYERDLDREMRRTRSRPFASGAFQPSLWWPISFLALLFAVLAGAAAVDPTPQVVPVLLALVLFLWTPPHFWSLAAAKGDDYARAGVPMLPVTAPQRVWTWAILLHTAALVAISLVPLWYGQGLLYGLGAGVGGAYFLWKSWLLYIAPSKHTATDNFFASFIQLGLLIVGVVLDALVGLA